MNGPQTRPLLVPRASDVSHDPTADAGVTECVMET